MQGELFKRRKKKTYPEFAIHKAIAHYCTLFFIPGKSFWHTTDNSNGMGGIEARRHQAKLKILGAQAGFPDGMVIYHGGVVFVEIKSPVGIVQPHQEALHELLRLMGLPVVVVRSLDDFRRMVKEYGIPTKENKE